MKFYSSLLTMIVSLILLCAPSQAKAEYPIQDFSSLLGMEGFTELALKSHFKLYSGYVKNTNLLLEKLATAKKGTPEYAELKRRLGWEFNGMRLHELYFQNLNASAHPPSLSEKTHLHKKIVKTFGSFKAWKEDFQATGSLRGIGWVILYKDSETGMLVNEWINEHDLGHLVGAKPLLIMDVFEHAYLIDYTLNRKGYIEAFFRHIDWDIVTQRCAR